MRAYSIELLPQNSCLLVPSSILLCVCGLPLKCGWSFYFSTNKIWPMLNNATPVIMISNILLTSCKVTDSLGGTGEARRCVVIYIVEKAALQGSGCELHKENLRSMTGRWKITECSCSTLLSVAELKHWPTSTCGRKSLFLPTFYSPSSKEARSGAESRKLGGRN